MHAWAKHCIDDEYISRRLETVYIDDIADLDGGTDYKAMMAVEEKVKAL